VRVFEETAAGRVDLVGFSLGGLDARHLAAGPLRERIAAIVTVSTPHRGTPLATYLLEGPERLASLSVQAMEFFGRLAWKSEPPNVAAALRELTPAYASDVFEAAHPAPEGVWCASYSARAGTGIYPPLRLSQRLLAQLAGDNDGLVPTSSAIWAEHLGTVDADHARLGGVGRGAGFDSKDFYLAVAAILRERGC
jgi:triacylglycerol lipase